MFKNFVNFFNIHTDYEENADPFISFINSFGGMQLSDGMFRVFKYDDLKKWNSIIGEAYKNFSGYFKPFGFDWLGRCFAIDCRAKTKGNILMFEIGTNDVLEIPCDFLSFLNNEIPEYNDECLASSFFYEWHQRSKTDINYNQCIGYKVPLFLGGEDSIDNLEVIDMEVYWSILSQIINQ